MKFKIDENLPAEVANALRDGGYDAETIGEEQMPGASDEMVAARVRTKARILVTLDLDFSNIQVYPPDQYVEIIVLRLKSQDKTKVLPTRGAGLRKSVQERLNRHDRISVVILQLAALCYNPRSTMTQSGHWTLISAGAFCAALILLIALFMAALFTPALLQSVYFGSLVLLGLLASAFIFGLLRRAEAKAHYSGNVYHGKLQISGPPVVFFLVILVGQWAHPDAQHDLKVYLHQPDGTLLKNGNVRIRNSRGCYLSGEIHDSVARFEGLSANCTTGSLIIEAEVPDFRLLDREPLAYRQVLEKTLQPIPKNCELSEQLLWKNGNPIGGANVVVNAQALPSPTGPDGIFHAWVPLRCGDETVSVTARVGDRQVFSRDNVPLPPAEKPLGHLTSKLNQSW